jgi:hypothetical protein
MTIAGEVEQRVLIQFKYLGSMLVNEGKLEGEFAARNTKAVFRFDGPGQGCGS